VPIPAYDAGGVLPPFLGALPGSMATQTPYRASIEELVHRFGVTDLRNRYLRGLLELRAKLRSLGVTSGFQWIDGSFVEDKEARGLEPGDIDIVTVFNRPAGFNDSLLWQAYVMPHASLFNPAYCKTAFNCEAFYIDLGNSGQAVAQQSAFWFGLFSHQRSTYRWKGIVEVNLGPDPIDQAASNELTRRGF
jgi:hypothetical protein